VMLITLVRVVQKGHCVSSSRHSLLHTVAIIHGVLPLVALST
jgi:hypothetical protein